MVTKKAPTRKKKESTDEEVVKKSVAEIVVERLIEKIDADGGVLPWHKPFQGNCMNWFTRKEYKGVNKILLGGGEYMTPTQITNYNKANNETYWFEKGTPWDIVVFYSVTEKKITAQQAQDEIAKGFGRNIKQKEDGSFVKESWVLRYFRVYNIGYIKNKEGKGLEPHIGNSIEEINEDAEKVVDEYLERSGVKVNEGFEGSAYYRDSVDAVFLPKRTSFDDTEAFYRVLFHELIHSTGVSKRLNRQCFAEYHEGRKERSKEELIAEVGGLLLASECGFREDTKWADNSVNYVAGWCSWMKNNPNEVMQGMMNAEKAKEYILSGLVNDKELAEKTIK